MCDPVSIGIGVVGAAASLYGTYQSSQAQSKAANAISQQNQAMQSAQNQAFQARLAAGQQQTAAQTAAMTQTMADRDAAATLMRQQQSQAMQRQQDILGAENQQATQLRQTGDTAAQQLLTQTDRPALDQSQAASVAQAAALLNPSLPQGPGATDPSGTDVAGSVQGATARRMAEAATNIRDYGSKIAQVGSYNQPLADISQAVAANRGATDLGAARDTLIASRGQNAMDAAGLSYGNAVDIANLGQSDAETLAKNRAAQAQADAQYGQQVGGVISGLGNIGLYGAGYYGGGPSWLRPSTGAR